MFRRQGHLRMFPRGWGHQGEGRLWMEGHTLDFTESCLQYTDVRLHKHMYMERYTTTACKCAHTSTNLTAAPLAC